jgi:hypothetical protein
MAYDPKLKEEEIKNKVAADLFPDYDCTRILGNVDFCVQPKVEGPTLWETESLLWAEAKAGVRADFAPLFAQLVLTVGGEKTFEKHSPPPFLGAFDCEKIAFLPWHVALDLFFRSDVDWSATPSDVESPAFRHVLSLVRPILDANLVLFRFGDPDLAKFAKKNLFVGNGGTNRLPVTRNNFPFVYQKWVKAVKRPSPSTGRLRRSRVSSTPTSSLRTFFRTTTRLSCRICSSSCGKTTTSRTGSSTRRGSTNSRAPDSRTGRRPTRSSGTSTAGRRARSSGRSSTTAATC